MKRNILFLISMCMLLISCSNDNKGTEPEVIDNEKEEISLKDGIVFDVPNKGGIKTISFNSNVKWTATSSKDWCTLSSTSGDKGVISIAITIAENKDYQDRDCTVTIKGGKVTRVVTIKQGENYGFIVGKNEYALTNEEAIISVDVKANLEFEVIIPKKDSKWISQVNTRALSDHTLEFKIAENRDYDDREGNIIIKEKDSDIKSTITVRQSQMNAIIISDKTYNVSSDEQGIEVEVKTNVEVEVIIPEEAKSWVSMVETRALRTEIVNLSIKENTGSETRTTEVYIREKSTDLQETITIIQRADLPNVYWVDPMGSLGTQLNEIQKDTITIMKVTGEINAADFLVMRNEMPNLKYVDLSEVNCYQDKIPENAFGGYVNPNQTISTIILPKNIKTIESWAFYKCTGLEGTLTLPEGLTTISSYAFFNCTGYTGSLVIPNSVETIDDGAFYGCSGFNGTLTLPKSLTTLGEYSFNECPNFTGSIVIPEGLKVINEGAFYDCPGFNGTVVLPEGLEEMGKDVFRNCEHLSGKVIFPSSLESMLEGVFINCNNIEAYRFPHLTPIPFSEEMIMEGSTVEVPKEAVETYKSEEGWMDCNIIGY